MCPQYLISLQIDFVSVNKHLQRSGEKHSDFHCYRAYLDTSTSCYILLYSLFAFVTSCYRSFFHLQTSCLKHTICSSPAALLGPYAWHPHWGSRVSAYLIELSPFKTAHYIKQQSNQKFTFYAKINKEHQRPWNIRMEIIGWELQSTPCRRYEPCLSGDSKGECTPQLSSCRNSAVFADVSHLLNLAQDMRRGSASRTVRLPIENVYA